MADETTTPNDTTAPTETQQATNGGTTHADKTFTQADLDRIAGETRQKATENARKKVYEELGIDDPSADKELLASAKARREADKTEVERLAGETAKEKTRADELQADLDKERAERLQDRRDSALKDAFAALNIKKDRVLDVLALLPTKQAETLAKTIKEDGTVDDKAVTKIAEDMRKAYPEWFGVNGVGTGSHSGGRLPEPGREGKELALTDLRERQRKGW